MHGEVEHHEGRVCDRGTLPTPWWRGSIENTGMVQGHDLAFKGTLSVTYFLNQVLSLKWTIQYKSIVDKMDKPIGEASALLILSPLNGSKPWNPRLHYSNHGRREYTS